MMSKRSRTTSAAMVATLVAAVGLHCLPVDARPTPASVLVTVSGDPQVKNGIDGSRTDGWSITFDKFVVSLGKVTLNGDPCTPYTDADYRRIFDARTLEPQKVSISYALGTCTLGFRISNPDQDTVLSSGVTDDDVTLMRTEGSDSYAGTSGISVYVKGKAQKDAVSKTFTWGWRERRVSVDGCTRVPGGATEELVLHGDDAVVVDLHLHGEVLFRDRLDPATAKLRFAPYALADDVYGDANGDVTLDELGKMTLAQAGLTSADVTTGDAGTPSWTTFEDFEYLGLFPQIVGLGETGTCVATIKQSH